MQTENSSLSDTTKTTCPYCGVGCGVITTRDGSGSITVAGDDKHPANYGRLCSKGSALAETIDLDGRLLYPEIDHQQVSWHTALQTVATKIANSIEQFGKESIAFYVSGQLLTEDYYVANKLMKGFIGTANIDTNSRLCMSSAVAGHKRAFGSDTVPCDYEDLEQANLIILTGSNLAWCHPVIYQRIVKAKKENSSLKIIVIDPLKTTTCEIADLHLPIKPGTDVMLFNGLLNFLQREGALNWKFLEDHTEGFASAIETAKLTAHSIPDVADYCDVPEIYLAEFYRSFLSTDKTVTVFSQGVNQSSAGTDKVNAIINCHLAMGKIGKAGMGPFSITGQPNAMGGREVGGLANQLAAHMDLDNERHRSLVQTFWQAPTIASTAGLKAVDLFQAVERGEIKVIWIMATNPSVSMPDATRVAKALAKCECVIVSDCIRNTDTTVYADILLPALAWGEKSGTVTNSERRISRQRTFLTSPGEAKADWWIISEVAKRMGFADHFNYQTPADIFQEHASLSGFQNNGERDFDISGLSELSDQEYDTLTPVQWPVIANQKNKKLFSDGEFFHPGHKARMIAVEPGLPENPVGQDYPLVLNTGRVRDHWHTLTRTGKSARLSSHVIEPYALVHPKDAARYILDDSQLVKVNSKWGSMVARCVISDEQRPGSVFVPMHWNKQFASNGCVDTIVNPATDPISGQPESKHTPVNVMPIVTEWEGFVISRSNLAITTEYWVRSIGKEHVRYHIAGNTPLDWTSWARYILRKDHLYSDWLEYQDESIGRFRAACITHGRLQSCVFIAPDINQLPDKSWLEDLFKEDELDKIERACLLAGKPVSGESNRGSTICSCFSVGRNTIVNAILEHNLTSTDQIGEVLQAGTNCGSCIPELKKILADSKQAAAS